MIFGTWIYSQMRPDGNLLKATILSFVGKVTRPRMVVNTHSNSVHAASSSVCQKSLLMAVRTSILVGIQLSDLR